MTELITSEVDRRAGRLGVALWPFLAIALAVAVAGVSWLALVDRVSGRDAAGLDSPSPYLVLSVAFGVWAGIVMARRALRASGSVGTAAAIATTGSAAGLGGAVALAIGALSTPARGDAPLLTFLRELVTAAPATTLAATAACALLASARPWRAPAPRRRRTSGRRLVAQGAVALSLVVPTILVAQGGIGAALAEDPVPSACPAGAPVKSFDIAAIDLTITYNRFGDNDPFGRMFALESMIPAIRAQEASRHVSIGLRDDPIQPLVIRANLGDCVEIRFRNAVRARADLAARDYGVHIDGLQSTPSGTGDAVGRNASSLAAPGETMTYRYYIPEDPALEGTHYMRPGPGYRDEVSHGLFGALSVQPKGSTYLNIDTGLPLAHGWGWEATIVPPAPAKAYRENVHLYHEVGNELFNLFKANGIDTQPQVDPHTDTYRPGARAINYRSEPFNNRLDRDAATSVNGKGRWKSLTYNSYTFGDPATPMSRGYLGDPTKKRILHAGSEVFHVYHLHGGGIRWRFNPLADATFSYQDTGLDKAPKTERSPSSRLDSQSFGPGEGYTLEIEGGAGGVQQSAGDFLEHCHIARHYNSGMWNFWRVYDTRQDDLATLPDRAPLPTAVNSAGLIGRTMPDGTQLTTANLDAWIRPQLPAQGAPQGDNDASVWDWTINTTSGVPRYLGEPVETEDWPNLPNALDGARRHPDFRGLLRGDVAVTSGGQTRPEIKFNPLNGRPAFPLLRPHINQRAPYAPMHGGAPWLGLRGNQPKQGAGPDPWANRPDGICPGNSPIRTYNAVVIEPQIQITRGGPPSPSLLFVLAGHKQAVLNGTKAPEPLAIRANVGECVKVTLTSEAADANSVNQFSMSNIHIHHVQFDVQASDGVGTGMQFGQAVRPYQAEDTQILDAVSAGDTVIRVAPAAAAKYRAGIDIAVGMGTDSIEVHKVQSVNLGSGAITLATPLASGHAQGQWSGTEFVQYAWYPDVQLDNVFWHDHVDGIHGWGHGAVGQLIVEPRGSTYHDPKTGAETDGSGTIVDIRTQNPLVPGIVDGSFREFVMWMINDSVGGTDGTINLRAEPIPQRIGQNADPSLAFSSYTHGDPYTPLPRAYKGDPMVIRGIDVSGTMDTLTVGGHRFTLENGFRDAQTGSQSASQINSLAWGVSERFSLILGGGAGGLSGQPGDYFYGTTIGRRITQGAWGLIRVLDRQVPDLQPLPGRQPAGGPVENPVQTGGRPVPTADPGNPCAPGAPVRRVAVSAVPVPLLPTVLPDLQHSAAFVPTADAAAVMASNLRPEPLVVHATVGECLEVEFTNELPRRASFQVDRLVNTPASSGINVGFSSEQSTAPGARRTYRYYVDAQAVGAGAISDGNPTSGGEGLYGAVVVAPAGARFTDPYTGVTRQFGTQVDVRLPNNTGYRDYTVIVADRDTDIGADDMPYRAAVTGLAMLNYRSELRPDGPLAFASVNDTDPATGVMRVRPGDAIRVHAVGAPASEQVHVFSLGGLAWPLDPALPASVKLASRLIGPRTTVEAWIPGGDKSPLKVPGDRFVGDLRRPFTTAGVWSLLRVVRPGENGPTPLPLPGTPGSGVLGGAGAGGPGTIAGRRKAPRLLFKLKVASPIVLSSKRRGVKTLGGSGVPVRFEGPGSIRAVRIELVRETKRGKKISRKLVSVVELVAPKRIPKTAKQRVRLPLVVDTTGKVQATWRIPAVVAKKIAAGTYTVRVRAGTKVTRLYPDILSKKVVLVRPKGS